MYCDRIKSTLANKGYVLSPDPTSDQTDIGPVENTLDLEERKMNKSQSVNDPHAFDIAFLHADVLVIHNKKDNTYTPLRANQILSPQPMIDNILKQMKMTRKTYRAFQSHLNQDTFMQTLAKNPKILILNCHGSNKSNENSLLFENETVPTVASYISEQQFKKLIAKNDLELLISKVQLVILSACHSENFGKLMIKAGFPVVVAIKTDQEVFEHSADRFNEQFLHHLINGQTVKFAFDQALSSLLNATDQSITCCCHHDHDQKCLWYKLYQKNPDLSHEIHDETDCECGSPRYDQKSIRIHKEYCNKFQRFIDEQIKGEDESKTNQNYDFLKAFWRSQQRNTLKMCCCNPEIIHNEVLKFKLLGDDKNQQIRIFKPINDQTNGELKTEYPDQYLNTNPPDRVYDIHWLYERSSEIHQIVQFILSEEQRLLFVVGPEQIGKSALIIQAVYYFWQRKLSLFSESPERVDVPSQANINQVILQIATAMKFSVKPRNEKELIEMMTKAPSRLIYFKSSLTFQDERHQNKFFKILEEILKDANNKVKIILPLTKSRAFNQERYRKRFIEVQISPLSAEYRYKFFTNRLYQLKNQDKFDKKIYKPSDEVFNKYSTWVWNQVARDLSETKNFKKLLEEIEQVQNDKKIDYLKPYQKFQLSQFDQLVPQENFHLRNFIFLLAQLPSGITKGEISFVCQEYPQYFGQFSQLQKVLIEIKVVKLQSRKSGGALSRIKKSNSSNNLNLEQKQSSGQDQNSQSNTEVDARQFLFNCKLTDYYDELVYRIERNYDETITAYIQNNKEKIQSSYGLKDKTQFQEVHKQLIKVQAENLLQQLSHMKRLTTQQICTLLTSHLDYGMWKIQPEKEIMYDQNLTVERFENYFYPNFVAMSEKYKKKNNSGQIQFDESIFQAAFLVVQISIQLERFSDAEIAIQICKNLISSFPRDEITDYFIFVELKLTLIELSLRVYKIKGSNTNDGKEQLEKIRVELEQTKEGFEKIKHQEGQAESLYLLAQVQVCKFMQNCQYSLQNLYDQKPQLNESQESNNELGKFKYKSLQKLRKNSSCQSLFEFKKIEIDSKSEFLRQLTHDFLQIEELFEQVINLFANQSNKNPPNAIRQTKCLLQLIECFEQSLLSTNHDTQLILKYTEKAFEIRKFLRKQGKQNRQSFITKLEAKSLILWAKIRIFSIQKQNQYDSLGIQEIKKQINGLKSRLEEDKQVKSDFENIQKQCDDYLAQQSKKLIVFANSLPLVYVEEDSKNLLSQETNLIDEQFQIIQQLKQIISSKEVQISATTERLTQGFFKSFSTYGAKILHLNSSFWFSKDFLCAEKDDTGLMTPIFVDNILEEIQSQSGMKVKCLVLAIPNSGKLAEQFINANLGVQTIIAFGVKEDFYESEDEGYDDQLKNYLDDMNIFCLEFYDKLFDKNEIGFAFGQARGKVDLKYKDGQNTELKSQSTNVIPLLKAQDENNYNKRLFQNRENKSDQSQVEFGQASVVKSNFIVRTNVSVESFNQYTHPVELHEVFKHLSNQIQAPQLVHVQGGDFSDLSSFVKAVAQRLLQVCNLKQQVWLLNLDKIDFQQFKKIISQDEYILSLGRNQLTTKEKSLKKLIILENIDYIVDQNAFEFETELKAILGKQPNIQLLISSLQDFKFQQFAQSTPNQFYFISQLSAQKNAPKVALVNIDTEQNFMDDYYNAQQRKMSYNSSAVADDFHRREDSKKNSLKLKKFTTVITDVVGQEYQRQNNRLPNSKNPQMPSHRLQVTETDQILDQTNPESENQSGSKNASKSKDLQKTEAMDKRAQWDAKFDWSADY